jgi:Ca2+-binding RTX toxin-like protein
MAIKNIVEYTEQGLKVFRPEEGERHLVYVRPGDKITLDFTDDIVFRIVDGDILAILKNGAQLVFLSLGSMSMTTDQAELPKLFDQVGNYIDVLNVAEISELSDQNIPIERRFLEFQPQSEEPTETQERLSRQEERLQHTLETINDYVSEVSNNAVAGPKQSTNDQGDEKSGTQTTVEFVQETVEKVVTAPESTTIPEADNPSRQNLVSIPQPDTKTDVSPATVDVPSILSIDKIEILGVKGGFVTPGVTPSLSNPYQGGSGSSESASNSDPAVRLAPEKINTASSNADTIVNADNPELAPVQNGETIRMTQTISISPALPNGFSISTISFSGLPNDVNIYSLFLSPNPSAINNSTPTLNGTSNQFNMNSGVHFNSSDSSIQFIINYPTNSPNFTLNASATATFSSSSGFPTPDQTTLSTEATYPIVFADATKEEDLTGNVLTTNPTGNEITTGAGNDTINGGIGVDIITAGEGDDFLNGNLGNDTLDGGGGSDSVSYINQAAGSRITAELKDNQTEGEIVVNSGAGSEVERDAIFSIENVTGSGGNDSISGNSSANTLLGGNGNDVISGGDGNDLLDGEGNVDTLSYAYNTNTDATGYNINLNTGRTTYTAATLGATQEIDTVRNFESVVGSSLHDTITGTTAIEDLNGGEGSDWIVGGGGNDVLNGGGNSDFQINIDSTADTTTIVAGDTTDNSGLTVTTTGINLNLDAGSISGAISGTQAGFENALGTSVADTISSSSASADNIVYATNGADTVSLGGNNTVNLTIANEDITIQGGDTYDLSRLDASSLGIIGSTEINLSSTGNNVSLNNTSAGTTVQQAVSGVEHIVGSDKSDAITGTAGSNYLAGGAGDDTITSGGGQDVIDGGEGNDQVRFDVNSPTSGIVINYDSTHSRYNVTDNSSGSTANPTLVLNAEEFFGSTTTDQFFGSAAADIFHGLGGSDTIQATLGEDIIFGDDGSDFINYSIAVVGDERFVNSTGKLAQLASPVAVANGSSALGDDAGLSTNNLASELQYNTNNVDLSGIRADMSVVTTDASSNTYYQVQYAENITGGGAIFRTDRLYSIENITGSSGNDYITGNTQANTLSGGDGNDFLAGRGGNDVLNGNEGSDILVGGVGNDTLDGGAGNDWASYQFSSSDATVDLSNTNAQLVSSSLGTDTLSNIENLITGSGNDSLTGTTAQNVLIAGAGNDMLDGKGGEDTLDGGEGLDTVNFSDVAYNAGVILDLNDNISLSSTATYNGTSVSINNIENITGSSGADTLTGNSLRNVIAGGAGSDILDGGGLNAGNDTLIGGTGNDTIHYAVSSGGSVDGGADTDTLNLSNLTTAYTINLNTTNHAANGFSNTTFNNIENVTTGFGNQTIHASATTQNTIIAGADNDIVYGNIGNDNYDGGTNNSSGQDELTYQNFTAGTGSINADFSANSRITLTAAGGGTNTQAVHNFEKLTGSQNDDTITLGDQHSTLISVDGQSGDDNITISQGSFNADNTIVGGNNLTTGDTLSFNSTNNTGINVRFNNGALNAINTISTGNVGETTFSQIENINGTAGGSGIDILTSTQSMLVDGSAVTVDGATINFNNMEVIDNNGNNNGNASTFENIDQGNFNTVLAGAGNDIFRIGATGDSSTDTMIFNGGGGSDSLTIDAAFTGATTLTGTSLSITNQDNDVYNLMNIETLNGGGGADSWNLTGLGNTVALNIDAGAGNDTITGSSRADVIDGNAGNDVLTGGAGNNTLIGGAGNDSYDITNDELIDFSDRDAAIQLTYLDGASTTIEIDSTGGGAFAERDSLATLATGDRLDLTGSTVNDQITITHGSTNQLEAINMNENVANTDIDTIVFNGSVANDSINNADVANFSNVEHLDFTGINTLTAGEKLTFQVTDLYDWAGAETSSIDNAGATLSGREIQLNFENSDISDWSDIRFDLSTTSSTTISSQTSSFTEDADDKRLALTNDGTNTVRVDDSTAIATNQYHVYFNDAGGDGNNLHVVINVT